MQWLPFDELNRRAVAIYCYGDSREEHLDLLTGDVLIILQQTAGWFYGYKASDPAARGVFPKVHVSICEDEVDPKIRDELRDWLPPIYDVFMKSDDEKFKAAVNCVFSVTAERNKILTSRLTADETKEARKRVSVLLGQGKRCLCLPVEVRDQEYRPIDPLSCSSVELYRSHVKTLEEVKAAMSQNSRPSRDQFSLVVRLSGANLLNAGNEVELVAFLYRGTPQSSGCSYFRLTESHVQRVNVQRVTSATSRFEGFKPFVFTDLRPISNEDRIILVFHVVRIGVFDLKKKVHKKNKELTGDLKLPYGVGTIDITNLYKNNEDANGLSVPIAPSDEFLDTQQARILPQSGTVRPTDKTAYLEISSIKFLSMTYNQVTESSQCAKYPVARRFGFSNDLNPSVDRNDLFLTLMSGEFDKGTKKAEKNVQIDISLHDYRGEKGQIKLDLSPATPNCRQTYKTTIYYQKNKVKWMEVVTIPLPTEPLGRNAHIRFIIRHRSMTKVKDDKLKPYGVAYLRLEPTDDYPMLLAEDKEYSLHVHKGDMQKVDYLKMPSINTDVSSETKISGSKLSMMFSPGAQRERDTIAVKLKLCSTMYTNNKFVHQILNYTDHEEDILNCLEKKFSSSTFVPDAELKKFARNLLHSILSILSWYTEEPTDHQPRGSVGSGSDEERMGAAVLRALVRYFQTLFTIPSYQEMFMDYLNSQFNFDNLHNRLLRILLKDLRGGLRGYADSMGAQGPFSKMVWFFKLIVKSKKMRDDHLIRTGHDDAIAREQVIFDSNVDAMIQAVCKTASDDVIGVLPSVLFKHIGEIINDLMTVFSPEKLTKHLIDLVHSCSQSKEAPKEKILCDVIISNIFDIPSCRQALLEHVTQNMVTFFTKNVEKDMGSQRIGRSALIDRWCDILLTFVDRLSSLWRAAKAAHEDVSEEVYTFAVKTNFLRTIVQLLVDCMLIAEQSETATGSLDTVLGSLGSVVIGVLQHMQDDHWKRYLTEQFVPANPPQASCAIVCSCTLCMSLSCVGMHDILSELLTVCQFVLTSPVYPSASESSRAQPWTDMLYLQSKEIITTLGKLYLTVIQPFFMQGEVQILGVDTCGLDPVNDWSAKIIHLTRQCLESFVVQPHLDLDRLPASTRNRYIDSYPTDLRWDACQLLERLWHALSVYKASFVIDFLPSILKLATVPVTKIREVSVSLIFDMMRTDMATVESHLVSEIDRLMETADEPFVLEMERLLRARVEQSRDRNQSNLVRLVTKQMRVLLEYARYVNHEARINGMLAINNLRNYYQSISRQDMYLRYLYKLLKLHSECGNVTEEGCTLRLISNHLDWSEDLVDTSEVSEKYRRLEVMRDLKEQVCLDSLACLEIQDWEMAIEMCAELAEFYRAVAPNYAKLSKILDRQSKLYLRIANKDSRPIYDYFLIRYYGSGYPSYIASTASTAEHCFIYRGIARLGDVQEMVGRQFPDAVPATKIKDEPGEDKSFFLSGVKPMLRLPEHLQGKKVDRRIMMYYERNLVNVFEFRRNLIRTENVTEMNTEVSEFEIAECLPHVLPLVPVVNIRKKEHGPHETAIYSLREAVNRLSATMDDYESSNRVDCMAFVGVLKGSIDAPVAGGLLTYTKLIDETDRLDASAQRKVEELADVLLEFIEKQHQGLVTWETPDESSWRLKSHLIDEFARQSAQLSVKFGFNIQHLSVEHLKDQGPRTDGTISRSFTKVDDNKDTFQPTLTRSRGSRGTLLGPSGLQQGTTMRGRHRNSDNVTFPPHPGDSVPQMDHEPSSGPPLPARPTDLSVPAIVLESETSEPPPTPPPSSHFDSGASNGAVAPPVPLRLPRRGTYVQSQNHHPPFIPPRLSHNSDQ